MRTIIFTLIMIIAFGIFAKTMMKLLGYLKIGEKDNRFNEPRKRIKNVLIVAIGQSKILREPLAGMMHAFIFWGFSALLLVVVESIIQGFYKPFSLDFLGYLFTFISFTQDIFSVLVLIAVIVSLYRRFGKKVKRLTSERDHKFEAGLILCMILVVILSMFGQNLFTVHNSVYDGKVITSAFKKLMAVTPDETLADAFWWIHILTIFTFMNLLPSSKHFHVITSIPNVYFSKLDDTKNTIKPMNLEDESLTHYGATDIEHLTWKQYLDGYTCTECGRCTAACPANNTGKALSPRKIIMDIRYRLQEKAPLIQAGKEPETADSKLVGGLITENELWSCTTCMACMQECPVTIEHIDSIVEMRRGLVLSESSFPAELNPLFKNLENNFSPWAFSQEDRLNWAEGMDVKVCSSDNNPEYLFWVGCAGAFDARYQKVTKAFAQIMNKAGLDYKVLGREEKCNGDAARRLGNEYLAQILMKENIQTLENYGIKKIITTCPHCFHSLKNEYKQFGGNYEVYHHTEMINKFLSDKTIQPSKNIYANTTFHDSCYLGRYNNIYAEPRKIITALPGVTLKEMQRNADSGFCCGAGGGRMWMEELEGKRVNIERTEEGIKTGADTICSSCPFCLTMFSDGLKTLDLSERIQTKDIAELVLESL